MTVILPPFPDVEAVLVGALAQFAATAADVGTVLPADLETRAHFILVQRIPGGGGDMLNDAPRVQIEVHASTRAVAVDVSGRIRDFLASGPVITDVGRIDTATTAPGFAELPAPNQRVRRFGAAFGFATRRTTPAP